METTFTFSVVSAAFELCCLQRSETCFTFTANILHFQFESPFSQFHYHLMSCLWVFGDKSKGHRVARDAINRSLGLLEWGFNKLFHSDCQRQLATSWGILTPGSWHWSLSLCHWGLKYDLWISNTDQPARKMPNVVLLAIQTDTSQTTNSVGWKYKFPSSGEN